jgi:carbamoyltransferase
MPSPTILGLHFGHDAAAAVVRDGKIKSCIVRERYARVKHALGLDMASINLALDQSGVGLPDIDYVAITTTQGHGLVSPDKDRFEVVLDPEHHPSIPSALREFVTAKEKNIQPLLESVSLEEFRSADANLSYLNSLVPNFSDRDDAYGIVSGFLGKFLNRKSWHDLNIGLSALREVDAKDIFSVPALRYGFHYPVQIRIDETVLPGSFVQHHICHAAYSFFSFNDFEAAILSHDGGSYKTLSPEKNGMFYYGKGNQIVPIAPHGIDVGTLYDRVSEMLGFGRFGAGKTMGLASYGRPSFYTRGLVGNHHDKTAAGVTRQRDYLWQRLRNTCETKGWDITGLGDPENALSEINRDLAASIQRIFEETVELAVESLFEICVNAGLSSETLHLTGGTALNCTTNARVFQDQAFANVRVAPATDDSGLAAGAALYAYFNLLDQPRTPLADAEVLPFFGVEYSNEEILLALKKDGDGLNWAVHDDIPKRAAEAIAADEVIGWMQGRSEIGPRALGQRSILADPRQEWNADRVNGIKSREIWRPFAPAVLENEAHRWFTGIPLPSPHMLFNARVIRDDVPAITHLNNTARVQTVSAANGGFHDLLTHFHALTGVPLVLNTSFNGPKEPIVQSPEDAVRFFKQSGLDRLYIGSVEVERRPTG